MKAFEQYPKAAEILVMRPDGRGAMLGREERSAGVLIWGR